MARVVRTSLARKSIKEIGRYIAKESGSRRIALRFLDGIELLLVVHGARDIPALYRRLIRQHGQAEE